VLKASLDERVAPDDVVRLDEIIQLVGERTASTTLVSIGLAPISYPASNARTR
jgi:hypothetical protein